MYQEKNNAFRNFSLVVLFLLVAASIVAVWQKQYILDYFALRNYTAPADVVRLADETTMSDTTRKVFYVNHPEISEKATFRQDCPSHGEQTIVLGCYIGGQGIYLLKVNDERLYGVMQVTAAHEVLHAEYSRLSQSEKTQVNAQLEAYFSTLQNDRIKKIIESYRKDDPSIVPNELHSILGTEVANLSPELESYYAQYFTNRKQIVAYSEKYEQTFVSLENQVKDYDQQLAAQKQTIDDNEKQIDAMSGDIEREKARLQDLLRESNTAGYNNAVPEYNALIRRYNALINQTKQQINEYNQLVEKRNEIAVTEQQLVEAINSNINTEQTE
jgi:uncharacterized protein YukE